MRPLIFCFALILLFLQYKLFSGPGGLIQAAHLDKQLTEKSLKNEQLVARNAAMRAKIKDLKSGDQAIEAKARYELGMVKGDEVYYQFVEK